MVSGSLFTAWKIENLGAAIGQIPESGASGITVLPDTSILATGCSEVSARPKFQVETFAKYLSSPFR